MSAVLKSGRDSTPDWNDGSIVILEVDWHDLSLSFLILVCELECCPSNSLGLNLSKDDDEL